METTISEGEKLTPCIGHNHLEEVHSNENNHLEKVHSNENNHLEKVHSNEHNHLEKVHLNEHNHLGRRHGYALGIIITSEGGMCTP